MANELQRITVNHKRNYQLADLLKASNPMLVMIRETTEVYQATKEGTVIITVGEPVVLKDMFPMKSV